MPNIAHFFDLGCLIKVNQQAWIVDKSNPSLPLIKISQSELKLAKSGLYKKKGNKIEFNGITYYLSDQLWNRIKELAIKRNININNLVISLQEFLNSDLIDDMDYEFDYSIILNMKKDLDNVYLICSEYTKNSFSKIIERMIEDLKVEGIKVKDFYYLNENFMNQDSDENLFKKIRLILQHLIGYKSEGTKFTDTEVIKYEQVHFFDNSIRTFTISNLMNDVLQMMLKNTDKDKDKGLGDVIKDNLREEQPVAYIYKVQENNLNPIVNKKVKLNFFNIVKKFESFKFYL